MTLLVFEHHGCHFDREARPVFADLARQTTKWDYEIDGLYVKTRDMLLKVIIEHPEKLNGAVSLLMVNRHIERGGDHICNICEAIVYMIEAKREHLN